MILVTGAAGLTGSEVVRRLSARGLTVRALVRNPAKAAALAALPGVTVVTGDLARPETLVAPLRDVARVMLVSSSAPDMREVQCRLVDAAARAGRPHLVKLSGIIAERDSPFRFARMHGEIEAHIEASGLPFTHLRAGEFMHAYFRQVPNLVHKSALMLPMARARIASIDIADLAELAVRVLSERGHEGKIYPLTGPEALTMAEVAEQLSVVLARPIRYVDVPPDAARSAQLAAGMPPYLADGLYELFAERRAGREANVSPVAERIFGLRTASFADFAARHAAQFRGQQDG